MARAMIGAEELTVQPARAGSFGAPRLEIAKGSMRSTTAASRRCATSR